MIQLYKKLIKIQNDGRVVQYFTAGEHGGDTLLSRTLSTEFWYRRWRRDGAIWKRIILKYQDNKIVIETNCDVYFIFTLAQKNSKMYTQNKLLNQNFTYKILIKSCNTNGLKTEISVFIWMPLAFYQLSTEFQL